MEGIDIEWKRGLGILAKLQMVYIMECEGEERW